VAGIPSIVPAININTSSGQLRTELLNTFIRLDGNLKAVPFRLFATTGPIGNSSTTETDLYTKQLNFNTLTEVGQSIQIFATGKTNANANNKRFKLKLGTTTLFDSGNVAANDKDWTFVGEVIANGDTGQIAYGQFTYDGSSSIVRTETGAEDLGTTLDLTLTGQGGASDDISLYYVKGVLVI